MSIKEIIKNERYKIDVYIGRNGNKRIRHIEIFEGKRKEAELRESEIKIRVNNNTYVKNKNISIADLIKEYIEFEKDRWSPKHYTTNQLWEKNIIGRIGHIKINKLTPKSLEEFYNYLKKEKKYAPRTIIHHYALINGALNKAILWGYVDSNPNKKVEKPKFRKAEIECYNPKEVQELIEALKSESIKYKSIIYLALDSGIRRSELTGLTWEDVNFNNNTIRINKTTQYIKGKGIYEKETKSYTSDRIIYITDTTANILKQYRKEQFKNKMLLGDKWEESNRVFTTDFGGNMHPDTPSKIFKKIIKKHNLKKISFHGLRHTSISLQIAQGVQAQIISKRAGHSSVRITESVYSHFFESEMKDVSNRMNTILSEKAN